MKNDVYRIKTDIVKEDKNKLNVNVSGENFVDAINSASYLKYNGEKLEKHIISAEIVVYDVYINTFDSNNELNPNYKPQEDKEDFSNLPPLIGD